jgi:hypothetical protein
MNVYTLSDTKRSFFGDGAILDREATVSHLL